MSLQVIEIYPSIQGESTYTGVPCSFVRLAGCPLRCKWCDTAYGFESGQQMSFDDIITEVVSHNLPTVELTGGEPLAQNNSIPLMKSLVKTGIKVLIETSGSISIKEIPDEVHIVMDLKCPDSRMSHHNDLNNLKYIKSSDDIKFVIASRNDFDWAVQMTQGHRLEEKCHVLFSPAWGLIKPEDLVSWILEAPVNPRLNLQTHKYIWSPRKKGV
ncbi:MAG: radical SAM protein [Oligoflexales bacterium]